VCGAFAGNTKDGFAKTSWYRVCQAAMLRLAEGGQAQDVVGEDHTYRRLGAAPTLLIPQTVTHGLSAAPPAWLRTQAPQETAARVLSPSRLTSASEPPVISPFGAGRAERLRRGSLIHLLFEVLPDLPVKTRRKAAETFLKRQADLTPDERREMLDATMGVLEDKRFASVFAEGGRAEAPVIGRLGADTINGRIEPSGDHGHRDPDRGLQNRPPRPHPPGRRRCLYIAQMAAYRAVLSQRSAESSHPVPAGLDRWAPASWKYPQRCLDSALAHIQP